MLKWYLMIILSFVMKTSAADQERRISFDNLPSMAQTFVTDNFPSQKVAIAKAEGYLWNTTYTVMLTNGNKLTFDKDGKWQKIACSYKNMPLSIIPQYITTNIAKQHPEAHIREISRDEKNFYVKLNDGTMLSFSKQNN